MRFLTMILFALLIGCTTPNYYTQTILTWRGANTETLINFWGMPDEKIVNKKGHTVFIYRTENSLTHAVLPPPDAGTGSIPVLTPSNHHTTWHQTPTALICTTMFEVNKNSIIIHVRTQGNHCYGSESFAQAKMNPANP